MKQILVYKDIAWREVGDKPIKEQVWPRNKTCPSEGEKRWIFNARSYINATFGERVWLLYQPALSFFNGWEEHPEELDGSALVEVEILKLQSPIWAVQEDEKFFLENPELAQFREEMEKTGKMTFGRYSPNEWKGWAKVSCKCVVPLARIPEEFPIVLSNEQKGVLSSSDEQFQTSTLTLHVTHHQEAHEWWIISHGPPRHLVLYCLDVSGQQIEVWNWLLSD